MAGAPRRAIAFAVAGGILGLLSIALASPLTRAHHYLLVLYFLPALVALRQGRTGWLLVICIVIVIESTFNLRLNYLPVMVQTGMVAGVAAMLTAIAAFAFSSGKPRGDQAAQRVSDK